MLCGMGNYAMLCNIYDIGVKKLMAKGSSGRIVIEVDPEFKRDLYSILAADGETLKDWFIRAAEKHIKERGELASIRRGVLMAASVKQ